ncbi:MAG TPA: PAS domain S-box protein, partial [Levilinea sp.]|nr:PAS domain S-box protein [Levilinea sp.]
MPAFLRDDLGIIDRLAIFVSAFILYVLIFLVIKTFSGSAVYALVTVPVVSAGWLFGPLAGVLTAIAGWGVGLLLQFGSGWFAWHNISTSYTLIGFPVMLGLGLLTGVISRLDRNNRNLDKAYQEEGKQRQEAASLLNAMLAATAEGVAVVNLKGDLLRYNKQFADMWKIPALSDSERNILSSQFTKSRVADLDEYLIRMQQTLEFPNIEHKFEIRLRDEKVLHCETIAQRQDDQTCSMILRMSDVTDWIQTKDALAESEQRLRWLINHSREGMALINQYGDILEWNYAMERLTGLKWEEVFHRPIVEISYLLMPPKQRSPEMLAKTRSLWKKILAGAENPLEPGYRQTIARRTDGKINTVEIAAFPLQTHSGLLMGVYYRDVTEHKKREETLRDQMRVVSNILNAYPDMAALLDISGRVLSANQTLVEAAGRSTLSLMGDVIDDFLPPAVRDEVKPLMEKTAQTTTPHHAEIQSSGQYFHLTIYPVSGESGKVNRVVLFLRNITESRQRERELEAVASISSALRAALTRTEVYPIILDRVETLLKADGIGLIVRDQKTSEVRVEQARGAWTPLLDMCLPADEATRAPVMIMDEPYLNNNIEKDHHQFHTKPFLGLKATACVPLEVDGDVIGSLWIGRKTMITKEDVRILSALAHITASAVHR